MSGLASPKKLRTPPLFLDLADKTEEARLTFQDIRECIYSHKLLGLSGQNEQMTCDCHEQWDQAAQKNLACGEHSDCINRATSVECVNRVCSCGDDCQNQRFQKRQYAPVAVIQTEKKGYGLRADADIAELGFIYEYVGEVINEEKFRKRMAEYDDNGFPHFYFMMLKKDSFIDATIKGSLARFCNHSCSPNAYVDKWVVGDKLRMGIFAKRLIAKGEEITFDYNVDRYGAQSQPCYCGEPNCIKMMGGKTQTDAALLLPDGMLDALGVTHQQERQWLKENKHLRSKQQKDDSTINEAFVKSIEVTPVEQGDVSKVMGALMRVQDVNITRKLVERIDLTHDTAVHSSIVRMHGYKTLSQVLQNCDNDTDTITHTLHILARWPKVTRNKILSLQIEDVVRQLHLLSRDRQIKLASADLLAEWGNLQMAYRIPKVNGDRSSNSPSVYGRGTRSKSPEPAEAPSVPAEEPLPEGWNVTIDQNTGKPYYYHMELGLLRWDRPVAEQVRAPKPRPEKKRGNFQEDMLARQEEERLKTERENQFREMQQKERMLQDVILQSQRQAEEKRQAEERAKADKLARSKEKYQRQQQQKKAKKHAGTLTSQQKWARLFAQHVPNMIKKHEKVIGHDNIKGCARELVNILASKETKKHPDAAPPAELERAKLKKIKEFCSSFMDKFLQKYNQRGERGEKRKREGEEGENKRQEV